MRILDKNYNQSNNYIRFLAKQLDAYFIKFDKYYYYSVGNYIIESSSYHGESTKFRLSV